MERIIPELIERLSHAERLERAINILHAWHKEYGTLGNIKIDSVLVYNGESVNMKPIITKIRGHYKNGKLNQETIKLLEDMGFEWKHDRWSAIRAYYEEFGTLEGINYKTTYEHNGKTVCISNIIGMLRQEYKKGTLPQEIIEEFGKMGIVWSIKMQYEDKVLMFKQYCLDGGELKDISKTTTYKYNGRNIKIGEIVSDLREKYANGELPEDIIKQLSELGMLWSVRPRINMDKMYVFRAYFKEHGTLADIKSTTKYTYQGKEVALGMLVFNWRRGERKEKLTQQEIDELTSMGMVWENKDKSTELKLDILKAYVSAGNAIEDVQTDTIFEYDGKPIKMYSLLMRLRSLNRKNKLSNEEKQIISGLGAVKSKKTLEERYAVLVAYYNQYGSLDNIASDEKFEYNGVIYNIGSQIAALRSRHTNNSLKPDVIEFLEGLGMVWRKRDIRMSFADKLEVLKTYTQQNNKTLAEVEVDEIFKYEGRNIKIHIWISGFRVAYASGELSANQAQELENLGIMWDGKRNYRNMHFNRQIEILEQYASEHGGTIRQAKAKEIYYYNGEKFYLKDVIYRLQGKYAETLTEEQIRRLSAIGMIWSGVSGHKINVLKAYASKFGSIKDIKMTEKFEYNGYEESIGRWMHAYRTDYKFDKLKEDIIKQLEELGMVWNMTLGRRPAEQSL